jgi:CheY-like chemotaxis protein/Tfp pilus assembly protein PilZ
VEGGQIRPRETSFPIRTSELPIGRVREVGDARRSPDRRLISRCRVELDHRSGGGEGETEDISASGLYVRTETVLPVGDETDLRLTLPDGSIVALYARVAHLLTPGAARALGRHAGIGLELIGPATPARAKLCAHLEALRSELTSPALSTTTQVMVVEPGPPLRARMARCLEAAGFQVTAAASAMDALDACAVARPDAVVAAAAMPAMTGVDLAYAMSEHATLSGVPVVLLGDDGDLGRLEAFRAGVRDYIPMPFLDEELVIRLHRVVTSSPVTSPGLRGSLVDIGLGTLLSLLEFERKSGVLLVVRTSELARVFLADGKILKVEATTGGAKDRAKDRPKDRLMRLLDWRDGQFEFSPADIGGRDELGLSVTQVLLEHARTRDEQRASAS